MSAQDEFTIVGKINNSVVLTTWTLCKRGWTIRMKWCYYLITILEAMVIVRFVQQPCAGLEILNLVWLLTPPTFSFQILMHFISCYHPSLMHLLWSDMKNVRKDMTTAALTHIRHMVYPLITLYISSYCCWQSRAFYMYCFLIYTSTKTQSSIDLFVSYCMTILWTSYLWRELKRIRRYKLPNLLQSLLFNTDIWCCLIGVLIIPYSNHRTQLTPYDLYNLWLHISTSNSCWDIQSRATRVTSWNSRTGYRARLTSNVRIWKELIEAEPSWLTRYDEPIEFMSEILIGYVCSIEDKQINRRQCFCRQP